MPSKMCTLENILQALLDERLKIEKSKSHINCLQEATGLKEYYQNLGKENTELLRKIKLELGYHKYKPSS